jgi:hypothetical protein
VFLLDILSHRTSVIAISQQLSRTRGASAIEKVSQAPSYHENNGTNSDS